VNRAYSTQTTGKVLLIAFYTVQGIGNFMLGLAVRVDVSPGGPGGFAVGMEIMIKSFLVFASCLSLFTALVLFLRREDWALVLGIVSSVLFSLFYGLLAIFQAPIAIVVRLLCLVIVFLNVVSIFFLASLESGRLGMQAPKS